MPEGGEVRGFVDSIVNFLGENAELQNVTLVSGRYTKKPPEGFDSLTLPLVIEKVSCKGKFIYFTFQKSDAVIFSTLGMSGSWSDMPGRHPRVKLSTSKGDLYFRDPRNFGTMKFTNRASLTAKLQALGPDMLNEKVTADLFIKRLRKHPDATLAEVLMNQGVVCGIGNYLKADSLWLAKLSPWRKVNQTSDEELANLCEASSDVIRTAYHNGGSTILTYKGFDGKDGNHTMLVYGQKQDPEGNLVVCQETKDGRTTWWAPEVQK
jgi:DNA-formamidopyrimidine glycosylase